VTGTSVHVLIVDDNEGDIELTRETLAESKLHISISSALDGVAAFEMLERAIVSNTALPDLILLDLNMPRLDGRGLLARMREKDELRAIPVVVLTSSDAEQDIVKSYRLGANCYVNKPVGLNEFQQIVRAVEGFWLTVVKLPS
jgi:two-component system, chemotaxis family, response regulator Rcp1